MDRKKPKSGLNIDPDALLSPPEDDKWKTYKDYLKRKREYKREWRKRNNGPQSIKLFSKRPAEVFKPSRDLIDNLNTEESAYTSTNNMEFETNAVDSRCPTEEAGEEDRPFYNAIEEALTTASEDEEYLSRRESIFYKLESLSSTKRLRILTIIEGLIDGKYLLIHNA